MLGNCGNGVRDAGETRDGGDNLGGAGCNPAGAVEQGWMCTGGGPGSCQRDPDCMGASPTGSLALAVLAAALLGRRRVTRLATRRTVRR